MTYSSFRGEPPAGSYPEAAYREPGVLWWDPPTGSGQQPGAEKRIAAWLYFNRPLGSTFTMPELRSALGGVGVPNDDEHLNRRLRQLRKDGWVIPSHREDASLAIGQYRVDRQGWVPWSEGARPSRASAIPARVRAEVLRRDGYRCVLCGVAGGEPQLGLPGGPPAVITVGHRIPAARGGSSRNPNNLRAECSVCNEPQRDENADPERLEELLPLAKRLGRADAQLLWGWLHAGERHRLPIDVLYDRARSLGEDERRALLDVLARMITPT